ncbi:uncharacterized protein ACJ7VT_001546 [Polymixia lowei]
MTGSKSSQTTWNIILVILSLWSIISLVVIVVWATSPDMKGSSQCRAELQEATEKLEGAKVVWAKNKVSLEEMVEEGRENQTRQHQEIQRLLERQASINASLEDCRQENAVLNGNITLLEKQIEMHRDTEANLTTQITFYQDQIDTLRENLTQASHQTESCLNLNAAAESHRLAAQSQTKACQSSQQYLEKQLLKCKVVDQQAADQTAENHASVLTGGLVSLLLCTSLHLFT